MFSPVPLSLICKANAYLHSFLFLHILFLFLQGFKPTFHIQYGGKNSTQGYIGYQSNINAIVVSFRGTEDVKNWATDLTAYRVHWPNCDDNEDDSDGGCSVHKGFYTAEQQVINDVLSEVGSLLNQYPKL